MMYYSLLASFCLLVGMAGSQTIDSLTACVTNDQSLRMECKFTLLTQSDATCTYEIDKKVAATNNSSKVVDSAYKNRGMVEINGNVCLLTLTGFADDKPKTYDCIIQQEKPVSKEITVEKKSTNACSAGNALMHGGGILLLAFVLPLLSGML